MGRVSSTGDAGGNLSPGELFIAVSSELGLRLISVRGELERGTTLGFIEACTAHSDESIVIDLGGLTFMDGRGYSSLVIVREIAEATQRTVDVRNAGGQPARLMSLIADLEATQTGLTGPLQDRSDEDVDVASDDDAERRYSDLLAEFAHAMWIDLPIHAFIDHLVERTVQVLPIDGAAMTLISPNDEPHHVAAQRAGAEGFGAPLVFPLVFEGRELGALNLYRVSRGVLSARQRDVAQTLAGITAAYLVNAEARTELVARTERANHAALHDSLTGLPNRALLFERLVDAMNRCRRTGSVVGILYIDLDTFKVINDTFGHSVGDEVLLIVAQRLTALLRPGDTVCRLGGDEFVVLCDDIPDATHLWPIAERVSDAFEETFDVSIGPLLVRASIGIGAGDWTSTSPDCLLDSADAAMYHAKRSGGGRLAIVGEDGETST